MALRSLDYPEVCSVWVRQILGVARSFFAAQFIGMTQALGDKEAVRGDAQAGVMVEASPASALASGSGRGRDPASAPRSHARFATASWPRSR
jgi:hypothetical protein